MEDDQSIDQDHGERMRGRKRKSSRAKSGLELEVLTFHCLFPTLQKENLQREYVSWKLKTVKVGASDSRLRTCKENT